MFAAYGGAASPSSWFGECIGRELPLPRPATNAASRDVTAVPRQLLDVSPVKAPAMQLARRALNAES